MVLEEKQIRSVFSQGIMHNFHSSTSEKRERKSEVIRGNFPLFNAGEREKISQEKRQNLSGEIKNNPFLFIRFALSLLLLFLHSSHCLPLTENMASGANHGLTAALFSSQVAFLLCQFGSRSQPQEKEKDCLMN